MRFKLLQVLALTTTFALSARAVPAQTGATPLMATVEQFRLLRWIEGKWRGAAGTNPPFYEGYHFLNDSTLRTYDYRDSTARTPTDSGVIALRAGRVTSGQYVLTKIGAGSAHFEPQGNARNDFTWTRVSADAWTAVLHWPAGDGKPERTVTYDMKRIR